MVRRGPYGGQCDRRISSRAAGGWQGRNAFSAALVQRPERDGGVSADVRRRIAQHEIWPLQDSRQVGFLYPEQAAFRAGFVSPGAAVIPTHGFCR